mgnify:CR=1 FL=1
MTRACRFTMCSCISCHWRARQEGSNRYSFIRIHEFGLTPAAEHFDVSPKGQRRELHLVWDPPVSVSVGSLDKSLPGVGIDIVWIIVFHANEPKKITTSNYELDSSHDESLELDKCRDKTLVSTCGIWYINKTLHSRCDVTTLATLQRFDLATFALTPNARRRSSCSKNPSLLRSQS